MGHQVARRRVRGGVIGLVSTMVALGVAELVAATRRDLRSPVFDVGARFIDATPAWLKKFAIAQFGTNDKLALLIGILTVVLIYGVLIGIASTRRRVVGVAGVVAFGVIGMVAAVSGGHGLIVGLPSVVGAIAGAATIWLLAGLAMAAGGPSASGSAAPTSPAAEPDPSSRRAFLVGSAAVAAVAVAAGGAGRSLSKRFEVAAARAKIRLPKARRPLPLVPAAAVLTVPGLTRFVTPNDRFYRIDTALIVPQVPVETWRLRVDGMVHQPLEFTFDELLARPLVEADITLTCVSNEVGGQLAGNARWLGVPLRELLKEAGVRHGVDQIVGRSTDGFTCGFPLEAALDGRQALVAIGMNGEPLPVKHGFPARLIVPGLYGYVSATKWLTQIELTRFDRFGAYWSKRGWSTHAPIKTFSRIDTPHALTSIPAGTHPIAGVAWAQGRGIDSVEVRVDGGDWMKARLADELNNTTWRQWVLPHRFTSGQHTVECRATDGTGAIQIAKRSEPMPDGATGWHSIVVLVA